MQLSVITGPGLNGSNPSCFLPPCGTLRTSQRNRDKKSRTQLEQELRTSHWGKVREQVLGLAVDWKMNWKWVQNSLIWCLILVVFTQIGLCKQICIYGAPDTILHPHQFLSLVKITFTPQDLGQKEGNVFVKDEIYFSKGEIMT